MNRTSRFLLCVSSVLLAGVLMGQIPGTTATDRVLTGCQRVVSEFESQLKGELTAALRKGGAGYAIGVCEITAPAVAARFCELDGWSVRRTALRLRNPLNSPDSLETAGLARLASDTVVEYYTWMTDSTGQTRFRYLSAIRLAPRCVDCHGDPKGFSGAVRAALAELYPLDQAVGFKPGELRGAYSVTIEWPQGQRVADSLWQAALADTKE